MNTLKCAAAAALLFGSLTAAQAACGPEEAQTKANQFAQTVQAKAQSDPQTYAQVMQELQPRLLELQQKNDLDALCAFYDEALKKLQ